MLAEDLVPLGLVAMTAVYEQFLWSVTEGNKVSTKKRHFLNFSPCLELNFSLVLKAEVHVLEQALLLFGNYMVIWCMIHGIALPGLIAIRFSY